MVMVPEQVKQEWEELKQNPVVYGQVFWNIWEQRWLPYFNKAKLLIKKNAGLDMSVDDSSVFYQSIKELTFFVDFLRAKKDEILLNKTVRSLIAHHVGNGIYKIFLLANFSDNDPEPILSEKVQRISTEINDLQIFWENIKAIEKIV